MKTFALVSRQDATSEKLAKHIRTVLNEHMQYDANRPDLVISIGGDGTMLEACHRHAASLDHTSFVGLHTGTLGFYTNYAADECDLLLDDILTKTPEQTERSLLDVYLNERWVDIALNEMRVEENRFTMVLDVYLKDYFFERFRGNGICVCTPAGSTGYNRSLGGSIVCAGLKSMQLSEVAGIHHNQFRSLQSSLGLDDSFTVTLIPRASRHAILGIDRDVYEISQGDTVKVSISNRSMKFANYRPIPLSQRLRRSFINDDQW